MTRPDGLSPGRDAPDDQRPREDAAVVLERRPVRDEARGEPHSCFGDDLWDLSAAVFEAHASPVQLDWLAYPEQMRRSF